MNERTSASSRIPKRRRGRRVKLLPQTDVSGVGNERDAGSARGLDRLDLIGVGLGGAFLSWTVLSGVVNGASPVPPVLVLLTSAVVFLVARKATADSPVLVPSLVLAAGLLLLAADPGGTFSSDAGSGAFGYANAKAAFSLLAAVAGLMIALVPGSMRLRIGALIAAAGFALVPVASDARTAAIVAAGLPMAVFVALRGGPRRTFLAACVVLVLATSLGTTALAIAGDAASLGQTLDRRRVRLWEEAADLMEAHPWFGVGPGRFPDESPTGGSDEDARWAHHDFLHQGAETGVPGFVLMLSLFLWALVRIGTATAPTPLGFLAAFAVAALAVVASFDHVLNFPLIAAAGAALAGTGAPLGRRAEWRPGGSVRALVKAAALPWGLASRRRPGDVVILLYHRVGAGEREIDVPTDVFDEQVAMLAQSGEVRSLEQALLDERGGVVVTFDDGFRDFHEHVVPTLVRHRVPAMLYLATGLIDGSPEALTWSQLEEVVSTGLVEVGGHTHGHTDLSRADEGAADVEMRRCRDLIEDRLGRPCRHFAYPWAVGSPAADRVARRMFDSAALDAWRTNRRGRIDRHRLGRTPVLRGDGSLFFRAKARGMLDSERIAYRVLHRGPWRRP
jgi:O-antigen ligase